MKVLTFSSRPQTACFHVVNGKRTAVVNRKLRKYADESSCHAGHTMRFCRRLPSTILLRKVPIIPLALVGYEMIMANSGLRARLVDYLPSHIQLALVE